MTIPSDEQFRKRAIAQLVQADQPPDGTVAAQQANPPGGSRQWPDPLPSEALYGLAGEVVRVIEPHSETDPAALLIQFLVYFGILIGRCAHFLAEADQHFTNLYAVVVGRTAGGRKGSSLGQIHRIFAGVEKLFRKFHVSDGLISGEGLIWRVRDPLDQGEAGRKRRRKSEEEILDPGVADKRLLVTEPEFAKVLQVSERHGNTLSPTIRQAWDSGDLRTLAKNQPAAATGAHIGIIGHITAPELRRFLTDTAVGNGFANRFLWVCSNRSKFLPDGGNLADATLFCLQERIRNAVEFARNQGRLRRDDEAAEVWRAVYPTLSEGRPGLLGSVTARAEAQTMRLALLFALLDSSEVVRADHLMAALAVWKYVEASAEFIFGDSLGDPTADTILAALRAHPDGLTRTEIAGLFNRHRKSEDLDRSLATLRQIGLAKCSTESTSGRDIQRWNAV